MTCVEFQRGLADFMDGGGTGEARQHLGRCQVCTDLVEDLSYIAEAARRLPLAEPSPRVWAGIELRLQQEARRRSRVRSGFLFPAWGGRGLAWGALAAVCALALAAVSYQATRVIQRPPTKTLQAATPAPAVEFDAADRDLLNEVGARHPGMRGAYEQNMREVNSYIHDARAELRANPEDPDASYELMRAYEQKATLYQMASTSP